MGVDRRLLKKRQQTLPRLSLSTTGESGTGRVDNQGGDDGVDSTPPPTWAPISATWGPGTPPPSDSTGGGGGGRRVATIGGPGGDDGVDGRQAGLGQRPVDTLHLEGTPPSGPSPSLRSLSSSWGRKPEVGRITYQRKTTMKNITLKNVALN